MKRYEKLGIDFNTVKDLTKVMRISCWQIGDGYDCREAKKCKYPFHGDCIECKAERLLAEVPTKKIKRWEAIKRDEDLENMWREWHTNVDLIGYRSYDFASYLREEIEVEE